MLGRTHETPPLYHTFSHLINVPHYILPFPVIPEFWERTRKSVKDELAKASSLVLLFSRLPKLVQNIFSAAAVFCCWTPPMCVFKIWHNKKQQQPPSIPTLSSIDDLSFLLKTQICCRGLCYRAACQGCCGLGSISSSLCWV